MSHHVTIPVAVGRVLGAQSALQQVRADRLIADVHEEVTVTEGTAPEAQAQTQTVDRFIERIDRVVSLTRLEEWETLYKDLMTVDIVTYQTALNLGLRHEEPSLGFLHNINHGDRAYTPVGLCSGREFVADRRTDLRERRDAIAREVDQRTIDRVTRLAEYMGLDWTIQFLESLLATSTHLGPLEDEQAISCGHLGWRLTQLRHNIADRITKVYPDWEHLERPINAQLPAGRDLEEFFGE
jgi:hypothetical protein